MPRYYQPVSSGTITSTTICDFKEPGNYSWTVPAGQTWATFEIWGGGGGGGAKCCCDCYHGGPGGASGGYAMQQISVTPGGTYAICVGYGGMVPTVGNCTLHWCCYGNDGSTTYVTGSGLSNFCATGGSGGHNDCYYYCGCTKPPGMGYGGIVNNCGSPGYGGHTTNMCSNIIAYGGSTASGGGNYTTADHCCRSCMIACAGQYPGGGGGTTLPHTNCCCAQGGVGGNGLVRIHF